MRLHHRRVHHRETTTARAAALPGPHPSRRLRRRPHPEGVTAHDHRTRPPPRATRPRPAMPGQHLAAIAAALAGHGITSRLTRLAGTPVLTTGPRGRAGPRHHRHRPRSHAGPGLRLDCTCIWTPAPGTTPQATAAVIAAVLHAARRRPGPARRPPAADAARLAEFLCRHPGWSAFWDPRYGLWRAAEDDPDSAWYTETPDTDAVISYITTCSSPVTPRRRPPRRPLRRTAPRRLAAPAAGRTGDDHFHAERAGFTPRRPLLRTPGLALFPGASPPGRRTAPMTATGPARPAASGRPDRPRLPGPVPRVRPARPGRDLAGRTQGHPVLHRPGHRRDRPADRRPRARAAGRAGRAAPVR